MRVARTAASQTALSPKRCHLVIAYEFPTFGLTKAFEDGSPMRLRYQEYIAASGGDVFKDFSSIGLLFLRQIPYLRDGFFKYLRHPRIIYHFTAGMRVRSTQIIPDAF